MARGIPAIVTPEVLQWARDLDRITIDEIAQKLNVDAAKVSAWENGNEHPSLTQAKKLAKQYRVPFAFFYLPELPNLPSPLCDGIFCNSSNVISSTESSL